MTRRTKLLLPVLAVIVLALTFGKAIGEGYYFGGCDEVVSTRHFIIHELGFKMCRDEHVESDAAAAPAETQPDATSAVEHEYSSPCVLYVQGHNARLEITGSEAVADCSRSLRGWQAKAGQGAPQASDAVEAAPTVQRACQHRVIDESDTAESRSSLPIHLSIRAACIDTWPRTRGA
jgi:hypothetical protein